MNFTKRKAVIALCVLSGLASFGWSELGDEQTTIVGSSGILTDAERCQAILESVMDAGFDDEVKVTCGKESASLYSTGFPSHSVMTGIRGTNEQIPHPTEGFYVPVRLNSVYTGEPLSRDSSIAVAVNGIPIFDYTAAGELTVEDLKVYQPRLDTLVQGQLDTCGGHTGRGDDYHYHVLPTCMMDMMDNKDENPIVGWAFDGYPLYGNNNPDGSEITEGALDFCNGQADPVFGYRYHTSVTPPYMVQCLMGEVGNLRELPRISTTRPSGFPPRGGVDDLVFTENEDGSRIMTYNYQGEEYFIKATATGDKNCFDYEYKTVTNGGIVETGKHCSEVVVGGGRGRGGPDDQGGRRGGRDDQGGRRGPDDQGEPVAPIN